MSKCVCDIQRTSTKFIDFKHRRKQNRRKIIIIIKMGTTRVFIELTAGLKVQNVGKPCCTYFYKFKQFISSKIQY